MPCPVLVLAQRPESFSENVTVKLMLEEGYYSCRGLENDILTHCSIVLDIEQTTR